MQFKNLKDGDVFRFVSDEFHRKFVKIDKSFYKPFPDGPACKIDSPKVEVVKCD